VEGGDVEENLECIRLRYARLNIQVQSICCFINSSLIAQYERLIGHLYAENAFAESFVKTLKAEEVYLKEYRTFDGAYSNIKQFIEVVYNNKRLHSSIGYLPPDEFEARVLNISLS